jgi:hypothetical protein
VTVTKTTPFHKAAVLSNKLSQHVLSICLTNRRWLLNLAYIADVTAEINKVNISIRGLDLTAIGLSHNWAHFKQLELWKRKTEGRKIGYFTILNLLLEEKKCEGSEGQIVIVEGCEN